MKTAYFKNGILYHVTPRNINVSLSDDRQIAYDADSVIDSDGCIYDPSHPESISNLNIPRFDHSENVTLDLSYILKMRCGLVEDRNVLPLFVDKALVMMLSSPIGWRRGDYLQVIRNYYRNGLFEKGDQFEVRFRRENPGVFSNQLSDRDEGEHLKTKHYFEDKWHRYDEHRRLKDLFPDLTPDSATVYSRNRTRQTKNYLKLRQTAEEAGFIFEPTEPYHYCRKNKHRVTITTVYDHTEEQSIIQSVECSIHAQGLCNGTDEFGNRCIYPCIGSLPLHWNRRRYGTVCRKM